MIRLHYANRLENLIEPLAISVAEQQISRPLETVVIVVSDCLVPSPFGDQLESRSALEQYVRFKLAERLNVAANLAFPSLRTYLATILEQTQADLFVLDERDLQLAVFECLRSPAFRNDPELSLLGGTTADTSAADERTTERRIFESAAKLGHLMYEYAFRRRWMLRKWRAGALVTGEVYRELERSQRRLFLSLFEADGLLRPQWAAQRNRRCMLLPDALEAFSVKGGLPPVLHFFGVTDADPIVTRALAVLSGSTELHVYALNPCREFWENMTGRRAADPRTQGTGPLASQQTDEADAESLAMMDSAHPEAESDCAALRLWGRSGRELTRGLNELADYDFDSHFSAGRDNSQATLLGALQDAILNGEPEPRAAPEGHGSGDLATIRFLACPGPRREVEAVVEAIWSLVQENEASRSSPPLRLHEIALIFPDAQRDLYLPHIESVAQQRGKLPLNVLSRPLASESSVAEAIELFLDLPLSRFTREEVTRVLTHPAIAGFNADSDSRQWRQWCEELGIVFGADARDLVGTYIPKDAHHWDQALRRLALGIFMVGERGGRTELFQSKDGCAYLPFEVDRDQSESVTRLICLARGLLASALELKRARLVLNDWADALIAMVRAYVQTSDSADERILDCYLRAFEALAPRLVTTEPVGYEVVRRLVARRIAQIEAGHGQLSYTGVVVGPLSRLHALPFKATFLLGLGAAAFPERERSDWRDLRAEKQLAGELTFVDRQRYWFLQTLLAAHDRFSVSYGSVDPQTGDPLDPSAVVYELQSILRGYVGPSGLERMTASQPVSRYDLAQFKDLRGAAIPDRESNANSFARTAGDTFEPISSDIEARQAARLSALREDLEHRYPDAVPPEGEDVLRLLCERERTRLAKQLRLPETWRSQTAPREQAADILLSLTALRRFLECPIQGTAQYTLAMPDDDPTEIDEDEPLSQPRWQQVGLLRNVFWQARGDREKLLRAYEAAFRLEQARGRAPFGQFADAQRQADIAVLEGWLQLAKEAGLSDLAKWKTVQIGPADEFAQAADLSLPVLRLAMAKQVADGAASSQSDALQAHRSVSLHARLSQLSPTLGCALQLVARDSAAPRDLLGPSLAAIALRAAGVLNGDSFEMVVLAANNDGKRTVTRKVLTLLTEQRALDYLRTLAQELLGGRSVCFFPIEAAAAILAKPSSDDESNRNSPLDIVRKLRDDKHQRISSDFGPLRNPRRFPAPRSNDEVREIIERRFGLLRQLFS